MTPKLTLNTDLKDLTSEQWDILYKEGNITNFDTLVKVEYLPKGFDTFYNSGTIRLICRDCGKTFTTDDFGAGLKSKVSNMINHLEKKHTLPQYTLLTKDVVYSHIFENNEDYNVTE